MCLFVHLFIHFIRSSPVTRKRPVGDQPIATLQSENPYARVSMELAVWSGRRGPALAHCWAWPGPCMAVSTAWGTQHWDWSTGGWGRVPGANSVKGVFLNDVCQCWPYCSRKTPPNGCLPCLSPEGESQCLLPLQEDLQDGQVCMT